MQFDAQCIACLVNRQYQLTKSAPNDPRALAFMKEVLQSLLDAPDGVSAPWCVPHFTAAFEKYYGVSDPYAEIKREANARVMAMLPRVRQIVDAADDPLKMALKFSRTGNYLDFAVLDAKKIDRELDEAIATTPAQELDETEYTHFRNDLSTAQTALILCDNAGEIALDRILAEQLHRAYPALHVQCAVRGGIAQNDATRIDALAVGMDTAAEILDNGSCIPATELDYCSDALRTAIDSADVIVSKGQANFESLLGCGRNVYYAFLCKCSRLWRLLGAAPMQGMFLCERRLNLPPEAHF